MTIEGHLEALKRKHSELEKEISFTLGRPSPDQTMLTRLKREKLKLKEEIERLNIQTRH